MPICATCGNDCARAFKVTRGDDAQWFDCFQCAIESLAPRCARCACRIIGHAVERDGEDYCCAHCARQKPANLPLFDP